MSSLSKMMESKNLTDIAGVFLYELEDTIVKVDTNKQNKRGETKSYKPSSMICMRKMYFIMTGEPKSSSKTASFVGICESGTNRHEDIQRYITKMKSCGYDWEFVDVEKYIQDKQLDELEVLEKKGLETKIFHKGLNMRFLVDGILKHKDEYYMLEIKTEASKKYYKHKDTRDEHVMQGCAYSEAFKLDGMIYLYENRDLCMKKAFLRRFTDEDRSVMVTDRIAKCNEYISECNTPPLPIGFPRDACTYCDFLSRCKKDK